MQGAKKKIWLLCVDFMQERSLYAIGGYMVNQENNLICFLVDFKEASSTSEACVATTIEAVQGTLEELNCIESELQITTFFKDLVKWLYQEKNFN